MNLSIYNPKVFDLYKSNSQIARVLSENWINSEMYCPCCLNQHLSKYPNNEKVKDFFCPNCKNDFQSKSFSKKFGRTVVDGEYNTMMHSIRLNQLPNFLLMHYSNNDWLIKNLNMIPRFFISSSSIEKRNPLYENARRAGWTGCNIRLDNIPDEGKISIIKNEKIIDKEKINKIWTRMIFLNNKQPSSRGWTSDVLNCIEKLSKKEFNLNDIYKFKMKLNELHPQNQHIEAKIRQQLQILRDNNIIKFDSRGKYSLIKS